MKTAVFVMRIPEKTEITTVFPPERDAQIRNTVHEKQRIQRYLAWKTLEAAVRFLKKRELSAFHPEKRSDGKWTADDLFFSISHTEDAVAAAVSDGPVGVDLENRSARHEHSPELPVKLGKRIRTAAEMKADSVEAAEKKAEGVDEEAELRFYARWTRKESLFKAGEQTSFSPEKLETTGNPEKMQLHTIRFGTETEFLLSVAGDRKAEVRYYSLEPGNADNGMNEAEVIRPFSETEWTELSGL